MNHDEKIIAESKKRYALQTERDAFLDGVQYCEDNLAWRMCCTELPPLEERSERFSQDVIIAVKIGNEYEYEFSYYDYHNEYWVGSMPETFIPNVVAWLPLPEFNHKAEKV